LPPPKKITRNAPANSQPDPPNKRRLWGRKEPERKKAKTAKENPTNELAAAQDNPGN